MFGQLFAISWSRYRDGDHIIKFRRPFKLYFVTLSQLQLWSSQKLTFPPINYRAYISFLMSPVTGSQEMRAACGNGLDSPGQTMFGDLVKLRFNPAQKEEMNKILQLRFRSHVPGMDEGPDEFLRIVHNGSFDSPLAPPVLDRLHKLQLDAEGTAVVLWVKQWGWFGPYTTWKTDRVSLKLKRCLWLYKNKQRYVKPSQTYFLYPWQVFARVNSVRACALGNCSWQAIIACWKKVDPVVFILSEHMANQAQGWHKAHSRILTVCTSSNIQHNDLIP